MLALNWTAWRFRLGSVKLSLPSCLCPFHCFPWPWPQSHPTLTSARQNTAKEPIPTLLSLLEQGWSQIPNPETGTRGLAMKACCRGTGPSGDPICGVTSSSGEGDRSWQPRWFFLLKEGPEEIERVQQFCKLDLFTKPQDSNVKDCENNNCSCYLGEDDCGIKKDIRSWLSK